MMHPILFAAALTALPYAPARALAAPQVPAPTPAPAQTAAPLPTIDQRAGQDPADSLWRAARDLVNRGEHERAADLYRRLRTDRRFSASAYRAPAYYWEAFTRQRLGSRAELQAAMRVLDMLSRDHPGYEGMAEANRLRATINGQLAQLGSADASRSLAETARRADQCDDTQLAAVEALMHMSAADAMPILRTVLQRRDCDRLREHALFIMTQKDPAAAESILLDAARNDPSPALRVNALMWLATTGSERALDLYEQIIRTATDRRLLEAAVYALHQQRSARTTSLLRALVARADAPADARAAAVHMLAERRDPETTAMLRSLYTRDAGSRLKEAILGAVAQQRAAGSDEWLLQIALDEREDAQLRQQALHWAAEMGTIPLERLVQLYRGATSRGMREQILFAISRNDTAEAVTRMMEIVRAERDPQLRRAGIHWLGMSKDPRVPRFLAELIGS